MPDFTEEYLKVERSMVDGHTFSNSSEYEYWAARWCNRCVKDSGRPPNDPDGCPIVAAAMVRSGKRPIEWTTRMHQWSINGESGAYEVVDTCTSFEEDRGPDDDPPPAPEPPPVCDGQLDLIDAYLDTAVEELTRAPVTA